MYYFFSFFNDTATTEIYTLSLHDALPISRRRKTREIHAVDLQRRAGPERDRAAGMLSGICRARAPDRGDRKSTRLNSSHTVISYAVFCLKKKKDDRCHSDIILRSTGTESD